MENLKTDLINSIKNFEYFKKKYIKTLIWGETEKERQIKLRHKKINKLKNVK